jgi:hypothetical protein
MFVTALLAASLSAPVPKLKPPVPYFPVAKGTKWVLEKTIGGTVIEVAEEMLEVTETDAGYAVSVTSSELRKSGPAKVSHAEYLVSGTTVMRTRGEDRWTLLDLGVKAGEGWKGVERQHFGSKGTVTYTVGAEEEVEVPAGRFKAVPVSEQRGLKETKSIRWYAPGVGVVKVENDVLLKWTAELKSFTPGKDATK